MFICRGSQCDLYLPHNRFEHHVSLYDKVELFDDIARDTFAKQAYNVSIDANVLDTVKNIVEAYIPPMFVINAIKTIKTLSFDNVQSQLLLLASVMLSTLYGNPLPVMVYIVLYIALYYVCRVVKNINYSLMNIFGYKHWMSVVYKLFWSLSIKK